MSDNTDNNLFKQIVSNNMFPFAIFDKEKIIMKNDAFSEMLELSPDENSFKLEKYILDQDFCKRVFTTQFLIKESVDIRLSNKTKNILFYSYKVSSSEVLCFLIDISIYIDAAIRSLPNKNMFIGFDEKMKEPIKNIINMSDLLESTGLTTEQKRYNEIILENSNVLFEIIEAVLSYSKLETKSVELNNEEFVYQDFINELQRIFSEKVEDKNLLLSFYIDKNVPEIIVCDKRKLKKILQSLIDNSIKIANSGIVNVSSVFHEENDLLEISVEDTNVGLSREDIKKIFTPFYTLVDNKYQGKEYNTVGLELIISKRLVELMGGKLHHEKVMTDGSKFVFTVKVIDKKHSREYAGKNKILVVDDDQINLMSFKIILRNLKYDFDIAFDGLEAVNILKEKDYDIVLMDMHMPKMNGVETIKAIRKMDIRQPKIVVFTGYKLDEIDGLNEVQYDGFIEKPIDPKNISKVLESLNE